MSKPPVISIILPTFNRGFIISRAVESVIGQTYSDWELLIIDDGSTDDTKKIIRPFIESDPRIRYIKQKNLGHVNARQKGIRRALGKIITFIDSDDYYKPAHLKSNLDFLKKNPKKDMIQSKAKILGNKFVPDITDLKKIVFKKIKKLPEAKIGSDCLLHQLIIRSGFKTAKNNRRTYVYDRTFTNSVTKNFTRAQH